MESAVARTCLAEEQASAVEFRCVVLMGSTDMFYMEMLREHINVHLESGLEVQAGFLNIQIMSKTRGLDAVTKKIQRRTKDKTLEHSKIQSKKTENYYGRGQSCLLTLRI